MPRPSILLVLLLILGSHLPLLAAEAERRPNFILILTDDLGYFFGQDRESAPDDQVGPAPNGCRGHRHVAGRLFRNVVNGSLRVLARVESRSIVPMPDAPFGLGRQIGGLDGGYSFVERDVLPQAYDSPTSLPKSLIMLPIPLNVASKLRRPVVSIRHRLGAVLWAAVPVAPVHEDGQPDSSERDVRSRFHSA
jgi:hypothetical protein